MEHMKEEIRIEAPVEHVWAFLCDTSRWHDWAPRMETSEWTGPFDKVGTTYVETSKMMGFEMKQTIAVVEVEPLKLIHEHTDSGPMDNYFRFERDGDTTRVIVESDWEMPAHIPGFIKSLMSKNWVQRNVHNMLGDFKALAEVKVPVPA
jgi:ligand-binding SRPBCC domain-containing protein